MEEPAAYGKFGLANLLELREECLREFQFVDAYISIKQRLASYMCACMYTYSHLSNILVSSAWRENEASLAVLPDLLMELDSMNEVYDRGASFCLILHLTEVILTFASVIAQVIYLPLCQFSIGNWNFGSDHNHKSIFNKIPLCFWQKAKSKTRQCQC